MSAPTDTDAPSSCVLSFLLTILTGTDAETETLFHLGTETETEGSNFMVSALMVKFPVDKFTLNPLEISADFLLNCDFSN